MVTVDATTRRRETLRKWFIASWPLLFGIVLRVTYGVLVGLWFSPGNLDDVVLMLEYASLRPHFTEPDMFSLAKYMGYPVLLVFTRYSQLPLSAVLSLIWSAAALLFYKLTYEISRKKWAALLMFFYVLFLPVAFEQSAGTRIYRNQILAPAALLTLGLISLVFLRVCRKEKPKRLVFRR